ncbi:hypothetical protein [Streptomyces roseoviridis]|uniref:Uncharacterized protein n=1 Tax=Streptomyces roseoviridis TaxID=67361 RepID=A0ABV5QNB8_9ACTN
MDGNAIATVVVAVAGVVGVLIERRFRKPPSWEMARLELEILSLLPDGSEVRSDLIKHVDATIETFIKVESDKRRDPVGIVLALVFMAASAVLFYGAAENGGAWWWLAAPAAFTGLFGVVGFIQSVRSLKRDTAGRAVGG